MASTINKGCAYEERWMPNKDIEFHTICLVFTYEILFLYSKFLLMCAL